MMRSFHHPLACCNRVFHHQQMTLVCRPKVTRTTRSAGVEEGYKLNHSTNGIQRFLTFCR